MSKKRWTVNLKWEPRDLWVGVFWDRRHDGLHIYTCLVPCLVVHTVKRPA